MVTGQRGDGCIQCPMGVYGSTVGLSLPTCTGSCPAGKFGTKLGQISANDCAFCPPGRFGSTSGAYGSESAFGKSPGVPCPGVCPRGKYSSKWGSITATDCKPCIKGYIGWQCTWAIQVFLPFLTEIFLFSFNFMNISRFMCLYSFISQEPAKIKTINTTNTSV